MRRGRPLSARGRGRSVERAEIGHHDPVIDARHAAAGNDLQAVRAMPFRRRPLHGTGGQIKARLHPREVHIGGVQIAQGVVGIPSAVEGHAALMEREHAALSLLGRSGIGALGAGRGIERPGAVLGRFPLRFGDDAVLDRVGIHACAARREHARDRVDLHGAGEALAIAAGCRVACRYVRRECAAADVMILINRLIGQVGGAPCHGRRRGGRSWRLRLRLRRGRLRLRRGGGCTDEPGEGAQSDREQASEIGARGHSNR